jgi:hypothetical protein
MTAQDFTATLLVDQTPEQVFNAINNVRGWWSEEIEGNTNKLNDVFKYHFEDIHRSEIIITEFVPNKKVIWQVLDNYFKPEFFATLSMPFTNQAEWIGTKIIFEISEKDKKTEIKFTHLGLVPEFECFEVCATGWNFYVRTSLLSLITMGKGQPNSTGKPMTVAEEKFHSATA